MVVDTAGYDLVKDPEKSVASLLVKINDLFLKLEASIGHFHATRQVRGFFLAFNCSNLNITKLYFYLPNYTCFYFDNSVAERLFCRGKLFSSSNV